MRVLVIEDDEAIRSVLERGLRAEGFEVDACADGSTGLTRALDRSHAAIVLDLLLPGLTGYKVCEHLRAEGVDTPILVLSAKSGEYDQIDVLDHSLAIAAWFCGLTPSCRAADENRNGAGGTIPPPPALRDRPVPRPPSTTVR